MNLLTPEQYQPAVARRFEEVAAILRRALPESRIEHVGASSIPGAISKGDLDICVIVPADRFDEARSVLEVIGYVEKEGTLQTPELRMLIPRDAGENHAVQLVAAGSRFEFFITFRDALRADASLVSAYNQLKSRAASLGAEGYREAKSVFIERVLRSY